MTPPVPPHPLTNGGPHTNGHEEAPGCVLAAPSCFGFIAFLCLLIGACAVHDLAI